MAYPLFSLSKSHRAQWRLFGVLGVARETLDREVPAIAAGSHCVVIDGRSEAVRIARSPLLTADLILIPAARSPLDRCESVSTPRPAVDMTPERRCRIRVTAFGRGQTVADMLRALLYCELPDHGSGAE